MFHEKSVLQPNTRALLNMLGPPLSKQGFFLVGGTALAIQLGHRQSIDLDFFTRQPFDGQSVIDSLNDLAGIASLRVVGRAENTLNLNIDDVKVDIIRYRYDLLEELVNAGHYQFFQGQACYKPFTSPIPTGQFDSVYLPRSAIEGDCELQSVHRFSRGASPRVPPVVPQTLLGLFAFSVSKFRSFQRIAGNSARYGHFIKLQSGSAATNPSRNCF